MSNKLKFYLSTVILLFLFVQCKSSCIPESENLSINVKDFGALGDGINDDTYAISKAIDHLNKKNGGVLFFPQGEYLISRTKNKGQAYCLNSGSNIHFLGSLEGESILKLSNNQRNYTRMIYVVDQNNVLFENLTFNGDRYNQNQEKKFEHLHGIFIQSSNNIKITRCNFQNTRGDGILIRGPKAPAKNIKVLNCRFYENGRNGITLGSGFDTVLIDSCFFDCKNIKASSIDSEPESGICKNVTISNCTIQNTGFKSTIITVGGHVPATNYQIYNNQLENAQLYFCNAKNSTIYNNTLTTSDPSYPSFKVLFGNEKVIIKNNRVTTYGSLFSAVSTKYGISTGVNLIDNKVTCLGSGNENVIYLKGAQDIQIENNIIIGSKERKKSVIYLRTTALMKNVNVVNNEISNFINYITLQGFKNNRFESGDINNKVFNIDVVEPIIIGKKNDVIKLFEFKSKNLTK